MRIGLQTWGSEGDVAPFLARAIGLVRAGHQATLIVTDNGGRDYRRHASEGGFGLVEVPLPGADAQPADALWREVLALRDPLRQVASILRHGYDPVAPAMLRAAQEMVAKCDLVVGHFFAYPTGAPTTWSADSSTRRKALPPGRYPPCWRTSSPAAMRPCSSASAA